MAHLMKSSLFASLMLLFLVGCGESVSTPDQGESCFDQQEQALCERYDLNPKVFVSPQEFLDLWQNGAHIIDGRSADDYAEGHVSGAINRTWRDFVYPDLNGIVFETAQELEEVAREWGLNNDQTVIVYGNFGGQASPISRIYWTLEYIGHNDVYLLDGNLEDLEALGVTIDQEEVTPQRGDFDVTVRRNLRALLSDVVAASRNGTAILVDTRTPDEFEGTDIRGENPRGGTIPGSVHFEWTRVFNDEGRLLPEDEILAQFEEAGINGGIVIGYCQSGVRSSFFYAVLRHLGYEDVRNYDGSAWEYSRSEFELD